MKESKIDSDPHANEKTAPRTLEVLPDAASITNAPAMDGTSHVEISAMRNIHYSREIIEQARAAFSLEKLNKKRESDPDEFLKEGERQIHSLWHGIEALNVHNTMFVVLFLIAIGEILHEVSNALPRSDFVRWRRRVFPPKQERYLQQAQQLAKMGDFAKKYASMGKKRLLILDNLKRGQELGSHDALFEQHPLPESVEEALPDTEPSGQIPLPDTTEDIDGAVLQEYADAIITHRRLKNAGISFASFDQAYLIAAYIRGPLPVNRANKIAKWVKEKKTAVTQRKWFDILVMNKLRFPDSREYKHSVKDSLNYILVNFNDYCQQCDFANSDWIQQQKQIIDNQIILQAHGNLIKTARALGIALSNRAHKTKDKDSRK